MFWRYDDAQKGNSRLENSALRYQTSKNDVDGDGWQRADFKSLKVFPAALKTNRN